MNKSHTKGFAMTTIVIAVLALTCILVLMGLAAKFIPPAAKDFFDSARNWVDDVAKRFGIDFGWAEEEEEIELSAIPEEYQIAFQGIYETFSAGVGDDMKEKEECLLEYPKIPNLKRNAIAFEEEENGGGVNGLKIFFIDDQGKRLKIKGFGTIEGLEPCFVAGKTKNGEVVAENFYDNWLKPVEDGGGAGGGPEFIIGDVKMFNQDQKISNVPDKLEVTGNSEIKKGTRYDIFFNPTFLYKADENHICFIPETHPTFILRPYGCEWREAGITYICFGDIREKIGCCAQPSDKGTCELDIEGDDTTRPPGLASPPPLPYTLPNYKTKTEDEENIKNKIIAEAESQGVDWRYALGIAYLEHDGVLAHEGKSSAGAVGLFQIVPSIHVGPTKTCGDVDISDLNVNIECGIKIIKNKYYAGCKHFHDAGCRDEDYCRWDTATRRYVGWACMASSSSCGTICVLRYNYYVELVHCYIEQFENPSEISVCDISTNKDVYYITADGEKYYTYRG